MMSYSGILSHGLLFAAATFFAIGCVATLEIENYHPVGDRSNEGSILDNFRNTKQSKLSQKKLFDLTDVTLSQEDLEYSKVADKYIDSRVVNKELHDAYWSEMKKIGSLKDDVVSCNRNGKKFKVGELDRSNCEDLCECKGDGNFECRERCKTPYFRKGKANEDPFCYEKSAEDDCCVLLICTQGSPIPDNATSTGCVHDDKVYKPKETWEIGCEQICACEAPSSVHCYPRCPELEERSNCIEVTDPKDQCCKTQMCDVTEQEDHVTNENLLTTVHEELTTTNNSLENAYIDPIKQVETPQNGSVKILFNEPNITSIEVSENGGLTFTRETIQDGVFNKMAAGKSYVIRGDALGREFVVAIPDADGKMEWKRDTQDGGCNYNGTSYAIGDDFEIDCTFCTCVSNMHYECEPIKCPMMGLDQLNETCIAWVPDPETWKPNPPECCPPAVKCASIGECYDNVTKANYQDGDLLPTLGRECNLACRCYRGNITCIDLCNPIGETPPRHMRCNGNYAIVKNAETCCDEWTCTPAANSHATATKSHTTPPTNFVTLPPYHQQTTEIPQKYLGPYNNPFEDHPMQYRPYPDTFMNRFPFYNQDYDYKDQDSKVQPNLFGPYLNWSNSDFQPNESEISGQASAPNITRKTVESISKKPYVILAQPSDKQNKYSEVEDLLSDLVDEVTKHPGPEYNVVRSEFRPTDITFPVNDQNETDMIVEIEKIELQTMSSVNIVVGVPAHWVGKRGSVIIKYALDTVPLNWHEEVFKTADGLLSTTKFNLALEGLKSLSDYKAQAFVHLVDHPGVQPESEVFDISTKKVQKPIVCDLHVQKASPEEIIVEWRMLKQIDTKVYDSIDGIIIRYRPDEQVAYMSTQILHRSITSVSLKARPLTTYYVNMIFASFDEVPYEFVDSKEVVVVTPQKDDIFNVSISELVPYEDTVQLRWSGVPKPADKYVNDYRFKSECGNVSHRQFLEATRDELSEFNITGLPSETECHIWMEVICKNGDKKRSETVTVVTKAMSEPRLLATVDCRRPMIGTGIFAAISLCSLVAIALLIWRKRVRRVVFNTEAPRKPEAESLRHFDKPPNSGIRASISPERMVEKM